MLSLIASINDCIHYPEVFSKYILCPTSRTFIGVPPQRIHALNLTDKDNRRWANRMKMKSRLPKTYFCMVCPNLINFSGLFSFWIWEVHLLNRIDEKPLLGDFDRLVIAYRNHLDYYNRLDNKLKQRWTAYLVIWSDRCPNQAPGLC